MSITIHEYLESHVEAVRQFNARLIAGGMTMQFPTSPVPAWLPKVSGRRLYQECFVAVDGGEQVRGGYILKHQEFWIKDRVVSIADLRLPISEGVVSRKYSQVGVILLRDALAKQPLLFGLGMGGYEEAVVRLMQAAGWSTFTVPFFFRVVRPNPFLRNLTFARRGPVMRGLLDAAAFSGLGWIGIRSLRLFHRRMRLGPTVSAEVVDDFGEWTDELWDRCRWEYGMTAVRNREVMQILYPKNDSRFTRLRVREGDRLIGFAVLISRRMSGHKYFGDMRLGSIVSCFGHTATASVVVTAATEYLESQDVDLIVSNHSHQAWQRGFRRAGFLRGPSNVIFASSKALTGLLRSGNVANADLHFNRGDGDGPINL